MDRSTRLKWFVIQCHCRQRPKDGLKSDEQTRDNQAQIERKEDKGRKRAVERREKGNQWSHWRVLIKLPIGKGICGGAMEVFVAFLKFCNMGNAFSCIFFPFFFFSYFSSFGCWPWAFLFILWIKRDSSWHMICKYFWKKKEIKKRCICFKKRW